MVQLNINIPKRFVLQVDINLLVELAHNIELVNKLFYLWYNGNVQ